MEHRDLALECGDMGRFANAENLLSQCERFYLKPVDAENTINQMEAYVKNNWYSVARREGVTEKDCEKSRLNLYQYFLEKGPSQRKEKGISFLSEIR